MGGTLGKYVLLIAFVGLLFGYFAWKEGYGKIGAVEPIPESTAGLVAFVRDVNGSSDIFTSDGTSQNTKQRTNDGAPKRSPTWSRDGKQICFSGEPKNPGPDGRAFQLYVLGQDNPRIMTYGSLSKSRPQWSPDGKLIGFLAGGAIKVIQPNGGGLKQIYPPPHAGSGTEEGHEDHEESEESAGKRPPIDMFRWSPVGQAVAGVQIFEGEHAATVGQQQWWETDGSQPNNSDAPQGSVMEPEALVILPKYDSGKVDRRPGAAAEKVSFGWYPDGSKLAVALSTRQGRHGIVAYRLDDTVAPPDMLFASAGFTVAPENPSVSPDGKSIAFELWRMSSAEDRRLLGIAVIPTEGQGISVASQSEISKVAVIVKDGSRPLWSPDGTRLLFSRIGKSGRDIWVSKADGSEQTNITNGQGDNFDAVWSPAR